MTIHVKPPRICRCCGGILSAPRSPIEALEAAPLSPTRRTIVQTLTRAYPKGVSADRLISAVYNASNEPDNSRQSIRVQLLNIRQIIAAYGWTIPVMPGGRGNVAEYRLEPLP